MAVPSSLSYSEENLIMGLKVQEQFLMGSVMGFLTDIPTRMILARGPNNLLIRFVAQAIAMTINAFWIVTAIRLNEGSMFSMKLIPFQVGLFSSQPVFQGNMVKIIEEIVTYLRDILPFQIPLSKPQASADLANV